MKRLVSVFVLLCALLVLCGSAVAAPAKNDILVVPVMDDFAETNNKMPAAWVNVGGFYRTMVFRRLLMTDEHMAPIYKDLASDWSVSDDGKTYIFTIRDGVTWHDGVPFTAEDVRWSLATAIKAPMVNPVFVGAFSKIVGAAEWKTGSADVLSGVTVDGNKLTIKLTEPVGVFPLVMAEWPPYPKHLLEKENPATIHLSNFWSAPVGNGPYKFVELRPGEYSIWERYDGFYGKKPRIAKIEIRNVLDRNTLIPGCQAGEFDYFATNNIDEVREIEKIPGYKVYPVDIFFLRQLLVNTRDLGNPDKPGPLADIRARQAVLYALDRKTLTEQLFPEQATVMNTSIPASFPEYWKDAAVYDYNPEKAKALLAEARVDLSRPLKLRYYYSDQKSIDFIDAVKYYLEQVGFKVEASKFQGDPTQQMYEVRDFDLVYKGLSVMAFEEAFNQFSSKSTNFARLAGTLDKPNVKFDEAVEHLSRASSQEDRTAAIVALQKLEQENLYALPLFNIKLYVVVHESKLQTAGIYGNEWFNYDRKEEDWQLK